MNERFAKTWLAGAIHIPGAFTERCKAAPLPSLNVPNGDRRQTGMSLPLVQAFRLLVTLSIPPIGSDVPWVGTGHIGPGG